MDMESLYDYGEEEQDFYEEAPGSRKGYPIDHRSIKVIANHIFKVILIIVNVEPFIHSPYTLGIEFAGFVESLIGRRAISEAVTLYHIINESLIKLRFYLLTCSFHVCWKLRHWR